MASATENKSCVKCPKGPGQVICDGCQQYFCWKHLNDHRQDLSQTLDDLTIEHDQLQENLIIDDQDDYSKHSLVKRVNQWEANSIEKIKRIADEIRQQLKQTIDRSKKDIAESLEPITNKLRESRQTEAFTEMDLMDWTNQLQKFRDRLENPPEIHIKNDEVEASSTHLPLIQLQMIKQQKGSWLTNSQTVAGGFGQGDALHQLNYPFGLDIDDHGTLFIADRNNHRIMRWKRNAKKGEIIAGGKGPGNRTDQLDQPVVALIDRKNDCLIISDWGNRRVVRWPLDECQQRNEIRTELIITNIHCVGLALDDEGSLYISDSERHEVRRYGRGDQRGRIVAGGNGPGDALNQLDHPRHIFVDKDQSVYVSDRDNHRVMKWIRGAKEGILVAGSSSRGNSLEDLSWPSGIFVDRRSSIYVADQGNDRVMRWSKDSKKGELVVDSKGQGSQNNQLNQPTSLSFDNRGNLYVADLNNHRIQCFKIE